MDSRAADSLAVRRRCSMATAVCMADRVNCWAEPFRQFTLQQAFGLVYSHRGVQQMWLRCTLVLTGFLPGAFGAQIVTATHAVMLVYPGLVFTCDSPTSCSLTQPPNLAEATAIASASGGLSVVGGGMYGYGGVAMASFEYIEDVLITGGSGAGTFQSDWSL